MSVVITFKSRKHKAVKAVKTQNDVELQTSV